MPDLTLMIRLWQLRAQDKQEEARRHGMTVTGQLYAAEAAAIRHCIADLLGALGRRDSRESGNGV